MRGLLRCVALALAAASVVAPSALGGTPIRVGAVEDAAKWGDPAAKMDLAKLAGFDTIRMTAQWSAGQTAPSAGELTNMQNAAGAAAARGIKPIVSIYNVGSSSTPADDASRAQFVQYATAVAQGLPSVQTFIVGNEPNSNTYWLPQFDAAGADIAASAYEQLLAASYDAIKAVRPTATVVGGALDPRGGDVAGGTKPTHSPTTFIRDLGAAYRASGRTLPIMDVFDQHVYADNSSLPPSMSHPNTTTIAEADYTKLVALLGQAFDGTAQAGSTLPILYGEFGVESIVPAAKAGVYTGTEPSTTKPVDEATQAAYYTEAFKLAMCQPNVIGIMVFHVSDESALSAWQSGPYYADDTAKSSMAAIRDAASAARAGTLTSCPDSTTPTAALSAPANGALVGGAGVTVSGAATDDVGVGKVELVANGVVVGTKYAAPYTFAWKPKQDGPTTLELRAYDAAGNIGSASVTVTADITAPETTITGQPSSPNGSASGARFDFSASESATFACSLDGAPSTTCTSPVLLTALAAGDHTFQVAATDAAGNVDQTPAAVTWTVIDTTPPETTLASVPADTTTAHDAAFSFTASEQAAFECSLDGAAWTSCASPATYPSLPDGRHTFAVRATDVAGNVDPTPASTVWTIVTPPPNDAFASANAISSSRGSIAGTTAWASKEPGEPAHNGNAGGHSVWYVWTAPANRKVTLTTSSSSFSTELGVYTGSTVDRLARAASGTTSATFNAHRGTTYRIAVDGANGASGTFVLNWTS
jgi:hypothetical protein